MEYIKFQSEGEGYLGGGREGGEKKIIFTESFLPAREKKTGPCLFFYHFAVAEDFAETEENKLSMSIRRLV